MKRETRQIETDVYVAFDGRFFLDADECEDYENMAYCKTILMLDSDRCRTDDVDKCIWIHIKSDEEAKIFKNVCDYYGSPSHGIIGAGLYHFDLNSSLYIDIDRKIDELINGKETLLEFGSDYDES